jgi:hypothetical protein
MLRREYTRKVSVGCKEIRIVLCRRNETVWVASGMVYGQPLEVSAASRGAAPNNTTGRSPAVSKSSKPRFWRLVLACCFARCKKWSRTAGLWVKVFILMLLRSRSRQNRDQREGSIQSGREVNMRFCARALKGTDNVSKPTDFVN